MALFGDKNNRARRAVTIAVKQVAKDGGGGHRRRQVLIILWRHRSMSGPRGVSFQRCWKNRTTYTASNAGKKDSIGPTCVNPPASLSANSLVFCSRARSVA